MSKTTIFNKKAHKRRSLQSKTIALTQVAAESHLVTCVLKSNTSKVTACSMRNILSLADVTYSCNVTKGTKIDTEFWDHVSDGAIVYGQAEYFTR